ncbi:MAG TPA: phosphotransferase [Myxococcota bacterium]|nr:phosphotransferase [Myxococcota bacterium]
MSDALPGLDEARRFLASHLGREVGPVAPVGEGAWSRCFGFIDGGRELVVRFGRFGHDFAKDRRAARFRDDALPIPEVLEVGEALGMHFAISTRVRGEPIERLAPDRFAAALPSLWAALDALRRADLSGSPGWGPWDASGHGRAASWREHLLAVVDDPPGSRTHGWRRRLRDSPDAHTLLDAGHARLAELVVDLPVTRHLVHADLINRNVLVSGDRIRGVFDWGCSLYGDFLYDLAWLEFWSPWHEGIAAARVRAAAERHFTELGLEVPRLGRRWLACAIHIGLEHLAYNAHTGDRRALEAVAARLAPLLDAPSGP